MEGGDGSIMSSFGGLNRLGASFENADFSPVNITQINVLAFGQLGFPWWWQLQSVAACRFLQSNRYFGLAPTPPLSEIPAVAFVEVQGKSGLKLSKFFGGCWLFSTR